MNRKLLTLNAAAGWLLATALSIACAGTSLAAGDTGTIKQQQAAQALAKGDAKLALQLYSEALTEVSLSNDRRASILNDRGVVQARLGLTVASIEDFNRAVQLFPELASVYSNRGNALLAVGQSREAIKDFDRAIALAPSYGAAFNNRANAEIALGLVADAERDLTQAVVLMPQASQALIGRGRLHVARGRSFLALRDLSRALSIDARAPLAYRARAEAKITLRRYDDAIEDFSRAIAFSPASTEDYLLRGRAYLLARNSPSALKDFARAIELNPTSNRGYEARGLANIKAEVYDEAEADLARALELDPRSAAAFAYRGVLYARLGQIDVAAKEIDKAVHLEPSRADVLWAKAELDAQGGRSEEAVAGLALALKADPGFSETYEALARLGSASLRADSEIAGRGVQGWRVVTNGQGYYAVNPEFEGVRVPLEMVGEGLPRVLQWDVLKSPIKGIGTLRYHAGDVPDVTGPQPSENVVLVDLIEDAIIAIEPHRRGDRVSTWVWDEGRVVVTSVDGVTDEIALRPGARGRIQELDPRERVAARNDAGKSSNSGNGPDWSPWSQPTARPSPPRERERTASAPERRSKPKTLLDLLFGN